MKFFLSTLLLYVALHIGVLGNDIETARRELRHLKSQYNAYSRQLEELKSGKLDLPRLFQLTASLQKLEQDLQHLQPFLEKCYTDSSVCLPEFTIQARLMDYDGPEVRGFLSNGDILACRAAVTQPAGPGGRPVATELFWQLYDSGGRPVSGVSKRIQTSQKKSDKTYGFRFRLDNLDPGIYIVGLTHYLLSDPKVRTQAVYRFRVDKKPDARITQIYVTDSPEGTTHEPVIGNEALAHCFIRYALAREENVTIAVKVTDTSSGDIVFEETYPRKVNGDCQKQRFGIRLEKGVVPLDRTVMYSVEIHSSKKCIARASVKFKRAAYKLFIRVPETIPSNDARPFTLSVPKKFIPPYTVDLNASTGLVLHYEPNALTGTVTGISESKTIQTGFRATVTDKQGRIANGSVQLRVTGLFDGKSQSRLFAVDPPSAGLIRKPDKKKKHAVIIHAPSQLTSGREVEFTLKVPAVFKPPYHLDLNPSSGLVVARLPGELSGTVTGIAQKKTVTARLNVRVRDAEGRIGIGGKMLKIKPAPEEKQTSKKRDFVPGKVDWYTRKMVYGYPKWERWDGKSKESRIQGYYTKKGKFLYHGEFISLNDDKSLYGKGEYTHGKPARVFRYTSWEGKQYLYWQKTYTENGGYHYIQYHYPKGIKNIEYHVDTQGRTYGQKWNWDRFGAIRYIENYVYGIPEGIAYSINIGPYKDKGYTWASISATTYKNDKPLKTVRWIFRYPYKEKKPASEQALADFKSENKRYLTRELITEYDENDSMVREVSNWYEDGRLSKSDKRDFSGGTGTAESKSTASARETPQNVKEGKERFVQLNKTIASMVPPDLAELRKGLEANFRKRMQDKKLLADLGGLSDMDAAQWEKKQLAAVSRLLVNCARAGKTTQLNAAALFNAGLITRKEFNEVGLSIRKNRVRAHYAPGIRNVFARAKQYIQKKQKEIKALDKSVADIFKDHKKRGEENVRGNAYRRMKGLAEQKKKIQKEIQQITEFFKPVQVLLQNNDWVIAAMRIRDSKYARRFGYMFPGPPPGMGK